MTSKNIDPSSWDTLYIYIHAVGNLKSLKKVFITKTITVQQKYYYQ
jgi:hypothetical protein